MEYKPMTERLKKELEKVLDLHSDILLSDDECEELTTEDMARLRIAAKHLWHAHNKLRDIKT